MNNPLFSTPIHPSPSGSQQPCEEGIPVVLVCYKRPNHTRQVLESLEKINIANLIIFSDAPKTPEDEEGVLQTRALIERISWTKPDIVYQTENQGLARSIVAAANYTLKKFDSFILLEDDCVPHTYFYDWFRTCLERYKNIPEVFGISGYSIPLPDEIRSTYPYDAYFFPRMGSWGWATWKDRWQKDNRNLAELTIQAIEAGVDLEQGGRDVPNFISLVFQGNLKDTWTLPWLVNVYLNKGCYVYPTRSHINNIGFDGTGLHCGRTDKYNTPLCNERPTNFPEKPIFDDRIRAIFMAYQDVPNIIYDNNQIYFMAKKNLSPAKSHSPNITLSTITTPQNGAVTKRNISSAGLKVVHLSSSDDGGAGIAAYRIHSAMLALGINSSMLVLNRKNNDSSVRLINTLIQPCLVDRQGTSPHFQVANHRWSLLMALHSNRPTGLEMFSDASSDVVLEDIQELRDADIINLHWVAGLVDYGRLSHIFRGKKLVWTLHDMNPFTGGCHYTGNCLKYQKGCMSCPQLGENPHFDYARYIFGQKYQGILDLDVTVAAPSNWLTDSARSSIIFSGKKIYTVPNGIPTDVFRASPPEPVRDILKIPHDSKVVLFGAFSVDNNRKGFRLLINALQRIPSQYLYKVVLVFFGDAPEELSIELPCQVKGLGPVFEEHNLAMIYSMADLFVIPSLEDNLPNTVVESLSCGTPVAGFKIGGIPDMVDHKKTGYLAEPFDTSDLANGIMWCLANRNILSREICSQSVRHNYNANIQAQRYINLYRSLLQQ